MRKGSRERVCMKADGSEAQKARRRLLRLARQGQAIVEMSSVSFFQVFAGFSMNTYGYPEDFGVPINARKRVPHPRWKTPCSDSTNPKQVQAMINVVYSVRMI